MTDQEFLAQFEACTLPKEIFKHHAHLRLAWLYLSTKELSQAMLAVTEGIQRYAASLGQTRLYHETLTQIWVYIVYKAMLNSDTHGDFSIFLENNPQLLNKHLPNEYYSNETLNGEKARKVWVEPDLKPMNF